MQDKHQTFKDLENTCSSFHLGHSSFELIKSFVLDRERGTGIQDNKDYPGVKPYTYNLQHLEDLRVRTQICLQILVLCLSICRNHLGFWKWL